MNVSLRRFQIFLLVLIPLAARAQLFRIDTLARGPAIQLPSAFAFVPGADDKFFFAERSTGRVRLFDGALHPGAFVTVPVEDEGEQGLLGLAVHPDYPDSPFVYVYYVRAIDRAGILERYRDQNGEGVSPDLLLFIARRDEATQNNGGVLRFGPDGKLYLAVGDHGARPSNAQDTLGGRNLRGKILRLNPDGTVPDDNPYPRKYFWSLGHRDPTGLGFDPLNGRMYVTEGGVLANEVLAVPRGANFGWPGRRPTSPDSGRSPAVLYSTVRLDQPDLRGVAVYRGDLFPRLNGKILFVGNADPTLWVGTFLPGRDSLAVEPIYKSNTGFSDVQVGPDGCIYLANGPYRGSRIVRLFPVAPSFVSAPPSAAVLGEPYLYTPIFNGTPPVLEVVSGPEGMTVDTTDWSVHWVPSKPEALARKAQVTLRARNGAGTVDQQFTVSIQNVNEPPSAFALTSPPDRSEERFLGEDPYVMFSWSAAHDPDLDTVRYAIQIDTVATFASPFLLTIDAGTSDSARVALPQASAEYYWRVAATDGKLTTLAAPRVSRISVIFSKFLGRERARHVESVIEPVFPPPAPLNQQPDIRYTVPRTGYVRLSVFNLLGQEVARLYDGTQQAGTYDVAISGANLPNGIYFYRLIAPGFAETKKIVVSR
ncbi:MAG TPA: PQQ-dependent sugar dehydrogenase [Bacteroidota bacterium]|nr:PQQ-dependent sugar dehydrogenase [Bacteroidota bacterium]